MSSYDKNKLAKLIISAKGEDRSIRQYAEDANISPSIISRIISETYKPGIKVLQRLVSEAAEPRGGVTLKDITLAAGYTSDVVVATSSSVENQSAGAVFEIVPTLTNIFKENRKNFKDSRAKEMDENGNALTLLDKGLKKFKALAWGIITNDLTKKGVNWKPGSIDELKTCGERPENFITLENEDGRTEWWFIFWTEVEEYNEIYHMSPRERIAVLMSRFILNEPNKDREITIVIDDVAIYKEACNIKYKNSFKGNLSVMLIDVSTVEIVEHCIISSFK